jgi:hypothetical protein
MKIRMMTEDDAPAISKILRNLGWDVLRFQ